MLELKQGPVFSPVCARVPRERTREHSEECSHHTRALDR